MNRNSFTTSMLCTAAVLTLASAPKVFGQAATPPPAAAPEEEAITLSPFLVSADEDKGGYQATSTLAGTRVRTDLKDVASAISVVTGQFLQDTGAKNSSDLLVYTPSTEVAGIRGNFSGVAGSRIYQENSVNTSTRVRGLDSADNTRDYFLTDIPWDGFNVGRVDLQRGPNSILFGVGSPAGIINTSTNDASFKTAYKAENRFDQYGSVRNSADFNQSLVPDLLAVRFAVVSDNAKFEQQPAFNNTLRYYGAMRFDPKLFNSDSHTSIRVKFENGDVKSNNPRAIPPGDDITLWFTTGKDAYGNPGYNKVILNAFTIANPSPGGGVLPGGVGGTLQNGLAVSNAVRTYWPDVMNYFEGTQIKLNQAADPNGNYVYPTGTAMKTIAAQPNTALGVRDANGNTLGGVNQPYLPKAIPMYSAYAYNVGKTAGYPGSPIPGGVYYANKVLLDPTIFNFYKKLLDGPNKSEWQKWAAFNATIDQSFFRDRLAFQVAFDHQDYRAGAEQFMAGENYNINVDINATYADGTANPNVGRPYAGNGASAPGLNYKTRTIRDSFRVTATGELRASDLLGNTNLAKIIGKHNFTGLFERYTNVREYNEYAKFATDVSWVLDNSQNDATHIPTTGQIQQNRSFEWVDYLGPTLLNKASASGANLTNVSFIIEPPQSQTVRNFNSNWNKPTAPNAPGYVDPTAAYTYTNYVTGLQVTGTQVDNPANYIGWTEKKVDWLFASNPVDYKSLVSSGTRTRFKDTSQGATWQGYLLNGDLVPSFGWRKDIITNYQTNAVVNPVTGIVSLNFPDDQSHRSDVRGESKTWGGVYHLPKSLMEKLPGGTTISLFYNQGKNFKADASRLTFSGELIPNASGKTKEYGVTITTLHDKLSLKVGKFNTQVAGATLADTQGNSIGGLGQNGYVIPNNTQWGYGWSTYLQEALQGRPGTNLSTYGDYASADGFDETTAAGKAAADAYNRVGGTSPNGTKYIGGNAIVAAWLNLPVPDVFFSSYGQSPAIIPSRGKATGNLRDSYPSGYADGGGPITGGGSSFGNHQTTVDTESKGTEFELNFQPTKNWNISANYSKTSATRQNIDASSMKFISTMTAFMNGPGGQLRMWWNGDTTKMQGTWNSSIVAPYALTMNELGHEAPEVAPWRFNAVSTYTFDRGLLKGVFVGGAFRLEAGRIIGYAFNPAFKNSISSDPNYASVVDLTLGGLDVNMPFRGSNEKHLDAWVGYSRKVTNKINWRVALNVRSVGENDKLVAARINPDHSIALARISQGMGWQLTNSFDF